MTLNTNIDLEDIINSKNKYKKVQSYILEFEKLNVPIAEVIFSDEEYRSVEGARNSLSRAIRELGKPYKVVQRKTKIFLINTTLT